MCVCSPFHVIMETGLTINIHVSTKTCMTGNNVILHKALVVGAYIALSSVCSNLLRSQQVLLGTLGLMLFTLLIGSFHFLLMRKRTPALPLSAIEWYCRWPL